MPRQQMRRVDRERQELSVAESEARHQALLSALPHGALLTDATGSVLLANSRARELLGLPPGNAGAVEEQKNTASGTAVPSQRRAVTRDSSSPMIGSSPIVRLAEATAGALTTGRPLTGLTLAVPRQDRTALLRVDAVPLLGDHGRPEALVTTLDEISDADLAADGPAGGEDAFRRAMQHSPIGIAVAALNGRFLRVNRAMCRLFGFRSDELQQRTLYGLVHPDELEETSLRIGELIHGDVDAVTLRRRYIGQGGMALRGTLAVTLARDARARPLHFVVQIQDATDLHRAQDMLTHLTLHDPLTGLPNRTLMIDLIGKALDRTRESGRQVAVLHCDVDRFKVVNDSAGHELGDGVLVEIGRRVGQALRPGDTAGRLGGDEFVVVCPEIAQEQQAVVVAERLQRAVNAPLVLQGLTITPRISIGIAVSESPDDDPLNLLRDADIATYRAKDTGRDRWNVIDTSMRSQALQRLELEHRLRSGISEGELELHFQPIVDVGTREVVGREALLRWNHPERGQLPPMAFLPLAEESGLIIEVGSWVLAQAARAAAGATESVGYVAVNVSPVQVTRPGLAEDVQKALAEAGLPAERLVIELTESVMLSATPGARREIQHLDELGVRVVVDDFGTGFSALSYLRDLPVSGIKVDRSFTAGLGTDPQCDRIVEALTGLAHGLGVDVVVEGVETERQRAVLASIGAEHAQGYLFGRPSPDFATTGV